MRFFQLMFVLTGVLFVSQLSAQNSPCATMPNCCKKAAIQEKTDGSASLAVAVALLPATNAARVAPTASAVPATGKAEAKPANCDPSKCDRSKCDPSKCDRSKCDPSKCDKAACPKKM